MKMLRKLIALTMVFVLLGSISVFATDYDENFADETLFALTNGELGINFSEFLESGSEAELAELAKLLAPYGVTSAYVCQETSSINFFIHGTLMPGESIGPGYALLTRGDRVEFQIKVDALNILPRVNLRLQAGLNFYDTAATEIHQVLSIPNTGLNAILVTHMGPIRTPVTLTGVITIHFSQRNVFVGPIGELICRPDLAQRPQRIYVGVRNAIVTDLYVCLEICERSLPFILILRAPNGRTDAIPITPGITPMPITTSHFNGFNMYGYWEVSIRTMVHPRGSGGSRVIGGCLIIYYQRIPGLGI